MTLEQANKLIDRWAGDPMVADDEIATAMRLIRAQNAELVAVLEEARTELQKHTSRLCELDISTRHNFPPESLIAAEATATWGQHMLVLEHIRAAIAAAGQGSGK